MPGGIDTSTSGSLNLSTLQNLLIDIQNGVYDVKGTSDDDGAPVEKKGLSEDQLNAILAQYGLKMVNGELLTNDGYALTDPTDVGAATTFGGAPPLPDVTAETELADRLRETLMSDEFGGDDASLMCMAFFVLAKSAMREMKEAKEMKRANQEAKIGAKEAELSADEQRIEKEQEEAAAQFGVACLAAIVAAVCCVLGGQTVGPALGNALAPVINKGYEMYSKNWGAQSTVDKMTLAAKRQELMVAMFEELIDEAKGKYDETKEIFKKALQILIEHNEREAQITNKVTSS